MSKRKMSNITRRGAKRKEPETAHDTSQAAPSGPIIVHEELANNSTLPEFPGVDAWEPTSTAAAIAANTAQGISYSAESAINNPLSHAAETSAYPAQPTINATELQYYHYQEFQDWLSRWHMYQHALTNYWREYNNDAFNRKYFELIAYKEKYGNCNVPSTYEEEEPLGKWVERMRIEANEGKLDELKIDQLKSLGFDFN